MNGIIILDKPQGKTSHDMVNFVRRLCGVRRVGHTGTLDPMATGVLPICVGNATKAADMLTFSDKEYVAELELGKITDTQDSQGKVLYEYAVSVSEEEIRGAVESFIGKIEQVPPMFSAIKKDGKKLYELARQGIEIEREKRKITIHDIKILEIDMERHRVKIDVLCSKGTYIRTLCDDIGRKLGTGAYMTYLRRVKTGNFTAEEAKTPEELTEFQEKGELESVMISVDSMFSDYPEIILNEKQVKSIINGVRMTWRDGEENQSYRLYDSDRKFLCISKCVEGKLRLEKSFWN